MQAGGDSTRKMPSAPPGGNPYSAARGDPSVDKARGDPSEETVPSAPFSAQGEQEQRPRTPPGFETKMPKEHTPPGQIFVREAQAIVFEQWPEYHRFEIWKSHFFREITAKSGQSQRDIMMWLKEIEAVTDIQSLAPTTDKARHRFESLDTKIATGLWRIVKGDFEKKLQIEERILQQSVPHAMLTGRQVAYRIFEHFKLPAARTAVLNITHLFALKMQKDDLRLYDLQWDEVLLQIVPEPPEQILETVYQNVLEQCSHFKPTMGLYKLHVSQGLVKPSYQSLKQMVKGYLQDIQNKKHEAAMKANQPGLVAPAVTAAMKKDVTCTQMAKTGKCSRGDRCPFGHSVVGRMTRSRSPGTKGTGKSGKKGKDSKIA